MQYVQDVFFQISDIDRSYMLVNSENFHFSLDNLSRCIEITLHEANRQSDES